MQRRRRRGGLLSDRDLLALFTELQDRARRLPPEDRREWVNATLRDEGTDIVEVFRARRRLRRGQFESR